MVKLSLDLPKYRLHLHLVRRRGPLFEEPLLPKMEEVMNSRSGNKVSRFFRHVFENRNIRKLLGANFAFLIIASSFIPAGIKADDGTAAQEVLAVSGINLKTEPGIKSPLAQTKVNQGYSIFHPGVDLQGQEGDPVHPIMAGVVAETQMSRFDYGNAIIVDHGNSITSLYAHLSQIKVQRGDEVTQQTVIGLVGSTGHSTGDHLHLEIRDHDYPLNPLSVLPR